MAVGFIYQTQGGAFTSAQPQLWSDVKLADLGVAGSNDFDLAPDGRRVAALMPAVTAGRHTVVFLDHFLDELQRRVR